MKPILLEMEGFGPYIEKTTIDFKKLPNYLTLISGDTGAGKTTIFDAICCALFGSPSGNNRSFEMMRSKMIDGEKETYVHFEFDVRGKQYSVTRSPSYFKKKKKGEGYTKKSSKATLKTPDEREISPNVTEVNSKIKEILGIEKKEFSQIAMIAQNDFMSMITESNKNQEKTFNRIFNAEKFTKFIDKVKEKTNEFNNKRNNMEEFILSNLKNSGFDFDEKFNSANLRNGKIFNLVHEKEELIKDQKKIALAKLNKVKNELESLKKAETEANSLAKTFSERDQAQKELLNLEDRKNEIEELKQKRKRAELARDKVFEPYTKFEETKKRKKTLKKQKEILNKNIEDLKIEININDEALKNYSEKEQDKLYHDYKSLQDELDQYKYLEETQNQLKDLKAQIEDIRNKEKADKDCLEEKKKNLESIQVYPIEQFNNTEERLILSQNKTKDLLNDFNKIKKELFDSKTLIESLQNQRKILNKKKIDFNQIDEEYRNCYKQFLESQAAFLADQLKNNQPCPVCGSLDHPHPAVYSNKKVTEDDVDRLKEDLDKSQNALNKEVQNYSKLKNKLELNLSQLINLDKSQFTCSEKLENSLSILKKFLTELKEDLNLDFKKLNSGLAYLEEITDSETDQIIHTLKELKNELEKNNNSREENILKSKEKDKLQTEITSLTDSLDKSNSFIHDKESEIQNLTGQEKTLKNQLEYSSLNQAQIKNKEKEKAYREYKKSFGSLKEKSKEYQSRYNRINGEFENINRELKSNQDNLEHQEIILNKALKEADFKDIKSFENNILNPEELQYITGEITEYDHNLRSICESIQRLNKILENSATRF